MRYLNLFVLFLTTLCIVGCTSRQEQKSSITPSAKEEGISASQMDSTEDIMTECELDSCEGEELVEHKNRVLEVFQQVKSKMPKHKKLLQEELKSWENYYQALKEVGRYNEESWNHYYHGVLEQGIDLLETSLKYIDKNDAKKQSKTRFTSQMIDKAYEVMFDSTTWSEYQIHKAKEYRKALLWEDDTWKKWMSCRKRLSAVLSGKTKNAFDECTNRTMRMKLLQLKNQNRGLGVISNDIMSCLLPDSCTDEALLAYPGFNWMWKKYCLEFGEPVFTKDTILYAWNEKTGDYDLVSVKRTGSKPIWLQDMIDYIIENRIMYGDGRFRNLVAYASIDKDTIPELILEGRGEAEGVIVLSWHNGIVSEIITRRLYFEYIPCTGLCADINGHMGLEWIYIYHLDAKGFKQLAKWLKVEVIKQFAHGDSLCVNTHFSYNGKTIKDSSEHQKVIENLYYSKGTPKIVRKSYNLFQDIDVNEDPL